MLAVWSCAVADEEIPLYEREAFDRITIQSDGQAVSLDVLPISDADRRRIDQAKPGEKLRVRLVDYPERVFEIDLQFVTELKTFQQLILEQVRELVAQDKPDVAFGYLCELVRESPDLPGLNGVIEAFLLRDAALSFRLGEWPEAWATLQELKRRNPSQRGLPGAVRAVSRRMLENEIKAGRYREARGLVQWIREQHATIPGVSDELASAEENLSAIAEQLVESAQRSIQARDWQQALRDCAKATQADPRNRRAAQAWQAILQAYPSLTVGVAQVPPLAGQEVPLEWNSERIQRLLRRQLVDQVGFGSDGGRYESPWARITVADSQQELLLDLDRAPTAGRAAYSAYDLSRVLAASETPCPGCLPVAQWLGQIQAVHATRLRLRLTQPMLRPERFLLFPLWKLDPTDRLARPFVRTDPPEPTDTTTFLSNEDYAWREEDSLREIREVSYRRPAELLEALLREDVQAVERVHASDVAQLRNDPRFTVREYPAPSLHYLVPNMHRPLPAQRMIRRALLYALNRPRLLREEVLGGANLEGCRVLTGPFPMGFSLDDPLAYAIDTQLQPLPYDPVLASVLYRLALPQVRLIEHGPPVKNKQTDHPKREPAIRLVHPASARASLTCEAIQDQWSILGATVELVELPPGRIWPENGDWDFVYVECLMTDPLHDTLRLFSAGGLLPEPSGYLRLALRQLRLARKWPQARTALQRIHRLIYEDLSVLPLWQIKEHFAVVNRLQGVGSDPLTFYQDLERWRLTVTAEHLAER
jgi:hypothetical protein